MSLSELPDPHPVGVCAMLSHFRRLTLGDPMDWSPPASYVHGISQARRLEWVVVSFSRGSSQPRDHTPVSYNAGRFFSDRGRG